MQTFITVGIIGVLSATVLALAFAIAVMRSKAAAVEPITDEEYPLPDTTLTPYEARLAVKKQKLMEALSTPARYQVITVLLDAEKPLTISEIFQRTTRLQHMGIGKVIRGLQGARLIYTVSPLRDSDSYYVGEPSRSQLESLLAEHDSKAVA